MYAIQNIKNGEFLYGTNYGYGPGSCSQNTSTDRMLTFDSLCYAKADFVRRQCSGDYRIVKLKPPVVERTIDLDAPDGYDCSAWDEPPSE